MSQPFPNVPAENMPVALIVGVLVSGEDSDRFQDSLDELQLLLKTLGVQVKQQIVQRRGRLNAKCLLGSGKVEEVKELAEAVCAELIVFDRTLTPPQVRNLETMTGREIMDRSGVILEIFGLHARTKHAKTQVEIAQLEYLLPRLSGAWTHFQRQKGGGVRARGMGEKQIEVDRRRARERIARLQRQLKQIKIERATQRKSRDKEFKVALVGYTNSGKTSIMKALTKSTILPKDELFATLDTSIRTIDPTTRPKILMSDTVGFIHNLPHGLIESFKSTLEEVTEADLLLHVVDVSHPNVRDHLETTQKVLAEIGAAEVPQLVILNKMDLVDEPYYPKILQQSFPMSIAVSSFSNEDIKRLHDEIYHFFEKDFLKLQLSVNMNDQEAISLVYQSCKVLHVDYEQQDTIEFTVQVAKESFPMVQSYLKDR